MQVTFSEPVSVATGENASLYSLNHGAKVEGGSLSADGTVATLTISNFDLTEAHSLTHKGIADRSANANTAPMRVVVEYNDLKVASNRYYDWSTVRLHQRVYSDNGYNHFFISYPEEYHGLRLLRTHSSDNRSTAPKNDLISFVPNRPAKITVAYNTYHATGHEAWLSEARGWKSVSKQFRLNGADSESPRQLKEKQFPAGRVTLGSVGGQDGRARMYHVIIDDRFASSVP